MPNLIESISRFRADIIATSLELNMLHQNKFSEDVGEVLVEAGELEDFTSSYYKSKGMQVDGYCFDEEYNNLNLIVTHWVGEVEDSYKKVVNSEVEKNFKRCKTFFLNSKSMLHNRMEIANEAFELAKLIYELKDEIIGVKVILITDGITEKRVAEVEEVNGVQFHYVVWDIERILQFIETGEKEEVVIDFKSYGLDPVPFLKSESNNGIYDTYLVFVPGKFLADIYSQWGTKMLDMNVRVFLSARGNVNKGIRDTIINEPEMFCAFNNGITVSAKSVENEVLCNGEKGISKIYDFQIVNGGQTVASLYHTRRKNKAELSAINVQMKLINISDHDNLEHNIARISEYSNTQNKVNLSDLAANEPPHPEIHEISKRVQAPDPTGGSKVTHWFYEKSRGSYEETKNLEAKTPAKAREYEAKYPKKQRFDKGMFGKVWNSYFKKPHYVSLGAQKNFIEFNKWLKEQDEDWSLFFKKTVALLILWNNAERVIRRQNFVGYRHNIVTYTLSWFMELTNMRVCLDRVWKYQAVDESILEAFEGMSHIVNEHIRNTDKNITEWCKREECWNSLKHKSFELSEDIIYTYIVNQNDLIVYDPEIKADTEIIEFCKSKGSNSWWALAKWLKEMAFLTGKQRSQCANMAKALQNNREPSIKLSIPCKNIWEEALIRGWTPEE